MSLSLILVLGQVQKALWKNFSCCLIDVAFQHKKKSNSQVSLCDAYEFYSDQSTIEIAPINEGRSAFHSGRGRLEVK